MDPYSDGSQLEIKELDSLVRLASKRKVTVRLTLNRTTQVITYSAEFPADPLDPDTIVNGVASFAKTYIREVECLLEPSVTRAPVDQLNELQIDYLVKEEDPRVVEFGPENSRSKRR